MTDLIDRQAAIDAIFNADTQIYEGGAAVGRRNYMTKEEVCSIIDSLPSAHPDFSEYCDRLWKRAYERGKNDALKRKKGKWELECDAEGEGDNLYRCSECGYNCGCQEYDIPNYCPNCGAYMRGEEDA